MVLNIIGLPFNICLALADSILYSVNNKHNASNLFIILLHYSNNDNLMSSDQHNSLNVRQLISKYFFLYQNWEEKSCSKKENYLRKQGRLLPG